MTITSLAQLIVEKATDTDLMIATAESCTGGLIAAAITDIAGSSAALDRGFVTYSNEAKTQMLGVPKELIAQKGAVSSEVAEAMLSGTLKHSNANVAIAVTGVAGPGGGSTEKPVGLVYVGVQREGHDPIVKKCLFNQSHQATERIEIRHLTVLTALEMLVAECNLSSV